MDRPVESYLIGHAARPVRFEIERGFLEDHAGALLQRPVDLPVQRVLPPPELPHPDRGQRRSAQRRSGSAHITSPSRRFCSPGSSTR